MTSIIPADPAEHEFNRFLADHLRPSLSHLAARRRRALLVSLAVAAVALVALVVACYMFMRTVVDAMGDSGGAFWPVVFLPPIAMAGITFSVCYILMLRRVVQDFQARLMEHAAEFLGGGILRAQGTKIDPDLLAGSLFFAPGDGLRTGERFASGGETQIELTDLRVAGKPNRHGLFFSARFPKDFAVLIVSRPEDGTADLERMTNVARVRGADIGGGLEWCVASNGFRFAAEAEKCGTAAAILTLGDLGVLVDQCGAANVDLYISCVGRRLNIAALRPADPLDAGMLDSLDLGVCRWFCLMAKKCLGTVEKLKANDAVWK